MIYLELFLGFLQVGLFSFGGAYGAIPLIRDVVLQYGWISEEKLAYMIAIAESTPGPIMVNTATYVGMDQAGILGALIATGTVVLPAFVIILLIMVVFKSLMENKCFKAILAGLKPCVTGIILATGAAMIINALFNTKAESLSFDWRALVISIILVAGMYGADKFAKKKLSPIMLIIISAVLGVILYAF